MRNVGLFPHLTEGALAGSQTRAMRLQRRQAIHTARSLDARMRPAAVDSSSE